MYMHTETKVKYKIALLNVKYENGRELQTSQRWIFPEWVPPARYTPSFVEASGPMVSNV